MTDKPVSHQDAEKAFETTGILISRLPDGTLTREAKRLQTVTEDIVHQVIEQAEST